MDDLSRWGWNDFFDGQLLAEERQASTIARIVEPLRGLSRAVCLHGEIWAESSEKTGPSVGDWVVGSLRDSGRGEKRLTITRTLERKNRLSRAAPGGKGYEQILCANVEVVFVMIAVTQHLDLAGVERYLTLIRDSRILPAIVLTKADSSPAAESIAQTIETEASGAPVHVVSVLKKEGLESLLPYFREGNTVVLLGASGAGKSTLVNYLIGAETQRVEEVRESDQKGRHTTTGRRLYALPAGGMVIDSPGIRELQRWTAPAARAGSKGKKGPKPARRFDPRRSPEE